MTKKLTKKFNINIYEDSKLYAKSAKNNLY